MPGELQVTTRLPVMPGSKPWLSWMTCSIPMRPRCGTRFSPSGPRGGRALADSYPQPQWYRRRSPRGLDRGYTQRTYMGPLVQELAGFGTIGVICGEVDEL